MSAFGQAGFGSRNRRNQLRSQGQMDPYGQQVRAAKQAPTFSVYQTQGTQQAAGQQQPPSPSQPAQQPAAAQPSLQLGAPAMPAYQQAQPVQPQSTGTPYSAPPKQDWLQSMSDDELKKSLSSWTAAGTSGTGGAFVDANLKAATAELARRGQSFDATGARRQRLQGDVDRVNRQISDWNDRAQPGQPRIGETFLVNGQPDQQWMQANQYWADQRRQAQTALDTYNAENPVMQTGGPGRASPGTAQPIQPQSQGTPYGADPGYADRVAAAAQQWNSTPAGSQKVDWEGNSVRRGLAEGYSLDMITRNIRNTGRFAADPEGAAKFANQVEQDWIASLSSGLPQKPGPNATASEVSAYFNASEAYGRQQKAQQARDERIAAEAAFNDPARTAGEPSQRWIDETRRRVIDWGEVPFGMHPFAFRQNLIAGKIDISGRPVTEETPAWARYDYQRPQSAPAAIQTIGNTPGQAQPIQPQSQGTPYQPPAAQASLEDRYRAIGMDPQVVQAQRNAGNTDQEMAQRLEALEAQYADGADARDRWALEASRRGVDPLAGAPLANRSAEQAASHSAAYAPPDTSLPPQDEGILAYLRQRDAPKPTAQPSQQLYRTAMNSGVPDQQLAFEQDAFRNMAQKAVDREAFHGANDPYVQQFLNRMQYQGFDPRQGLSVSQHIQDAQAMRQRHAAARG